MRSAAGSTVGGQMAGQRGTYLQQRLYNSGHDWTNEVASADGHVIESVTQLVTNKFKEAAGALAYAL